MTTSGASQRDAWSRVAAGWLRQAERFQQFSAPVTARMLELAQVQPGHHVLDVACGVGEPALAAARRVGERGSVTAFDVAAPMVEYARDRAEREGLANVTFHCRAAEDLDLPPDRFDSLTMRWGLMFLPDASKTLRRVLNALRPGARAVFACWMAPQRNPVIDLVQRTARELLGVPEPDPDEPHTFSYADGKKLRRTLRAAGLEDVQLEELRFTMLEVGDAQEYWAVMSDLSATVNGILRDADDRTRAEFVRTLLRRAETHRVGDRIRFPAATWVARGARPT